MDSLFTSPEFQMSLLLFVALGGYLIASRINQSAVIGLILVGLLVGPSVLGWITYTDFVRGLAHLGAVILLFVIGLEFNVKEILSLRNGVIAAVGVIVPWIGGYWLSIALRVRYRQVPSLSEPPCTATSIAITANVLKEMGKLQTDAAKAIIGAAVIDDVLSLLALAISTDVVSGTVSCRRNRPCCTQGGRVYRYWRGIRHLRGQQICQQTRCDRVLQKIPGVHLHLRHDGGIPLCNVCRSRRALSNCRCIHCRCLV